MLRLLLTILLSVFFLYGYVDSDLDGVDDSVDKCPNTPFSDLVNEHGCSVKSLVKKEKKKDKKSEISQKKIVKKSIKKSHKKKKKSSVKLPYNFWDR